MVLLPDNDESGVKGIEKILGHLVKAASRVRMLHLQGLPDNGDLSDWFNVEGNDAESLQPLIKEEAVDFFPSDHGNSQST